MDEGESLSHVHWDRKYHVVPVPKYRREVLWGKLRRQIGTILRQLCQPREVEVAEGRARVDHVHMCLTIPPR